MKNFSRTLLRWFDKNKRDLPWRETKNPYHVWLSEVILQQTRVAQGMDYYLKFIARFPTVHDLASADLDEVLKLWQGLGYYSRARNLHTAAKQVVSLNKNRPVEFPSDYHSILQLKGVGTYTAAAISSICFDAPHAVVDGNVYRVLSRVFGVSSPIDTTEGKKEFQQLADSLLDKKQPGDYNQALMEFGAIQCTPKNPDCTNCIFQSECVAFRANTVSDLPIKSKKVIQRNRYFYYFILESEGKVNLRQRENTKDIWMGLYEFPMIEFSSEQKESAVLRAFQKEFQVSDKKFSVRKISSVQTHILSHQKLFARFFHIQLSKVDLKLKSKNIWVKKSAVNSYALPRLIDKYWNG